MLKILLLIFVFVMPLFGIADEETATTEVVEEIEAPQQENMDMGEYNGFEFASAFTSMLLALFLIILLILIAGWVFKRLMNARVAHGNTSSAIKILEKRSLNPKASIYLLDIYGKGVIVGETPSGLHHLGDIPMEGKGETFSETLKQKLTEK